MNSDGELVKGALSGDRAAFGALVERHRATTVRLAARMLGDALEADDAAQEACLHAYLTLDRLRDPERFGAWLYGIVVNLCRMRLRARRATRSLEDWDGGRVAPGFHWSETQLSPEAVYEIRELHAILLRAIDLLPDEQRAAVRWHYLDGLTLTEIAALSGAPSGTVKARLHRARERLRTELTQHLKPDLPRKEKPAMIEVVVQNVLMRLNKPVDVVESASRAEPGPETPAMHRVVILKEKNGERLLPMWIGTHEADMLSLQLAGGSTLRPVTYELTARLLEAAHAVIERVAVSKLHEKVFYATLWLKTGGAVQEVDARPSDALNLALRVNAPIFVAPEVMDGCSVKPDDLSAKLDEDDDSPKPQGIEYEWVDAPAPDLGMPKK
jgi:RNA polymerase sigma factor (sigma-70 family)